MTAGQERFGFLVQRSDHAWRDEVAYRVSKDGWNTYIKGEDWDEIGLDDDEVFQAFFVATFPTEARRRQELAHIGINT